MNKQAQRIEAAFICSAILIMITGVILIANKFN